MIEDSIKQFRFMRQQNKDRLGTQAKTKERMGLAQRELATTSYEMRKAAQMTRDAVEEVYNPQERVNSWADEIEAIRRDRVSSLRERVSDEPKERTVSPVEVPPNIREDSEFQLEVQNLAEKYGISVNEIYAIIQGESAFNPQAQNPSGATGLFQFMPATAEELGTTTEAIKNMSAAEQVRLYDRYLSRWNYSGDNSLGIMQAAPAFASSSPEEVIYAVGSPAWRQNPGWRTSEDGPITVRSINNYYERT